MISQTVRRCVDDRIVLGMTSASLVSDAESSVHMSVVGLDLLDSQALSSIRQMEQGPGDHKTVSVMREFPLWGSRYAPV